MTGEQKKRKEKSNAVHFVKHKADIMLGCIAYKCFMRPDKVLDIWDAAKLFFQRQGIAVDIVFFLDYSAQVRALVNGVIDIAWNTPLAYIQTKSVLGNKCQIVAMRDTDLENTCVLITPAGSSICSISDFKKQSGILALGSSDSLYANILPRYFLQKEGIIFSSDKKLLKDSINLIVFERDLGKHGDTGMSEVDVLQAVIQKKAHVGALARANLEVYRAYGMFDARQVRVIWESPAFSHCNLTSRIDVDKKKIRLFQQALFRMNYNDPRDRIIMELEGLHCWIRGNTRGYGVVERATKFWSE